MSILVAPSILSADFANLKKDIDIVKNAGADWIHVDVMDGMFVPNITVGSVVLKSLKKHFSIPFDVHLMIEKPERYIEDFVKAGADIVTIHPEACYHPHRTLDAIRKSGAKAGIALNPSTPLSCIEYLIDKIDLILIMTVNPGFGGQEFIQSAIGKIQDTRMIIESTPYKIYLEVDGGINVETGKIVVEAGANVLVSGNAIFKAGSPETVVKQLKSL